MSVTGAVLMCVTVIFVTEVPAWTIDLPEVRRFYFEKFSKQNEQRPMLNENQTFYDNIQGDSLYNTDRKHHDVIDYFRKYEKNLYPNSEQSRHNDEPKKNIYARAYNHDMYMLRKVSHGVLANGPEYLDGLRLAIERYMEVLENCSRSNFTADLPPAPLTSTTLPAWREFQTACRQASAASEHVRRLAELALWATRRLQDVAHSAQYSKDASMEENELLLRLAWYLDKLAYLTGYEPQPEPYVPPKSVRTPSPPIPAPNPLNISDAMKLSILNCLKEKSEVPATERCAVPNTPTLEEQIAAVMSVGGTSQTTDTSTNPSYSNTMPKVLRRSSDITPIVVPEPEILEATATDNRPLLVPTLTAVRSVKKRSVTDNDNPLVKLMKYYAKHTVWEYSNPKQENLDDSSQEAGSFDVGNHLTQKSIQKRSVVAKKHTLHINHEHKPIPFHHVAHKIKVEAVKAVLDKLYGKKILSTHKVKHLDKIFRHKREISHAYTHYMDLIKPRVPENPQKDIGYYVRNKEGTDYNANLAQAALLRASLEAVFQRGNIEVVHRYGSNYNPAVPAPLYAGVVRSISDV